ncbi:alpha/beta-tubulin-N-acetyltransferase 9 [Heteronotia binoei]|uniref:alpha/beta-tubulin-N-acetyltransferase 9 n=1 Tax=Heteronotia binoei TaxID=13085 RepID=UPI00292CCAFA|nr:alpha/beta-tubulin-N-acetyltransferase 9 [Heteronotia binoei]XP_060107910.1 alpha/beta-tubulin-N-acetyltransferase 9 [Heteronotia binoei]XP_060107911.1 alpha/beta-tubulin-N-acetyltransferase 9 [Heteronotia binoei]
MRINQNTVLQGKRVTLVPYTSAHVPRYHEWMKSEELQRLTASEPLSLEQEYDMQRSWQEDTDKCTFIILDTEKWSRQSVTEEDCMVGDVNLFLTDSEDPTLGEIEVMIGEASYRGRGFGKEATQIMMSYGIISLGLVTFEAKIGLDNKASISMFKKLHFKEVGVNSVFQEVTLRLKVDEQEREWLLEQTSHVDEKKYNIVKLENQACDC